MRFYVFKSDANGELRAFTGDMSGSSLPEKFRPWHAVGAVAPGEAPPHALSREVIEKAIEEQGFQLWRLKAKANANAE
jgi:hypothetical protein